MECGGLSVMEEGGTPGMPLWCAGSCATSMKVRTLIFITYTLLSGLMKVSTGYTLKPFILLQATKTLGGLLFIIALLVELVGNGEVLEKFSLWIRFRLVVV